MKWYGHCEFAALNICTKSGVCVFSVLVTRVWCRVGTASARPVLFFHENTSKFEKHTKVENVTYELEFSLKGPEFLSSDAGLEGMPKPRKAAASISFS